MTISLDNTVPSSFIILLRVIFSGVVMISSFHLLESPWGRVSPRRGMQQASHRTKSHALVRNYHNAEIGLIQMKGDRHRLPIIKTRGRGGTRLLIADTWPSKWALYTAQTDQSLIRRQMSHHYCSIDYPYFSSFPNSIWRLLPQYSGDSNYEWAASHHGSQW